MPTSYNKNNKNNDKPRDTNPHWKGYCCLIICSLINFSAISNVPANGNFFGNKFVSVSFGIVTFCLAIVILFLDYFNVFVLYKIGSGKLEGIVLLLCVLWWVIGVAYTTQVNGIGYVRLCVRSFSFDYQWLV